MSSSPTVVTKVVYKITRSKGNASSTITTRNEEVASKWLDAQRKSPSGITIKVVEVITTERELTPNG